MSAKKMTMTATGDSFITRRLPPNDAASSAIKSWMNDADVKFTNLETTTHRREGYPSRFSGGTWALSEPEVLDDLQIYGFNMLNMATNHVLDYGIGGLKATEREVNARGFVHAGVGETLSAASEPRYLDTVNGRVALVAATTSFHPSWIAGDPTVHIPGRPGVNALRHEEVFEITAEQMQTLKDIAASTYINGAHELSIKEGFDKEPEDGVFQFADKQFRRSEQPGRIRKPLKADMERITASIQEAKKQADYTIVSLHSHEMGGLEKSQPSDFLIEASRAFVDAGADAIFGHGPHIVRGIEIYQQKPIFYSLGDFIFQNETVQYLPADFFEKHNITGTSVAHAFDVRSDFGKKGLGANPHVWESVIAKLHWGANGLESIELKPIDLGYGQPRYTQGWPEWTEDDTVLERLRSLSEPFNTKIEIEEGVGYIRF